MLTALPRAERSGSREGPIEVVVALGADDTPALTLANSIALSLPDATCIQSELDEVRRSVDPADLGTAPLSIQIDRLNPDVAVPEGGR